MADPPPLLTQQPESASSSSRGRNYRGRGSRGGAARGTGAGGSSGTRQRQPRSSTAVTVNSAPSDSAVHDHPPHDHSHHDHPHSHDQPQQSQQTQQTQPKASRRSRFNSQLTTSATSTSSTPALRATSTPFLPPASSATPAQATAASPSSQTLLARLTHELTTATYDCCICFSPLSRVSSIHSCSTCYAPVHLVCIRKWGQHAIASSLARIPPLVTNNGEGIWRCPSCQTSFPSSELPTKYACFCGRVTDPKPPSKQHSFTPHSCGTQCERKRPEGCNHPCGINCHPGPCPPCGILVERVCGCGKEKVVLRCSALGGGGGVSCGKKCEKKLGCGLHSCEKECHQGPCGECEVVRIKKCFCGREEKEEICDRARFGEESAECCQPGATTDNKWIGEWSCKTICDAPYDCLKHRCLTPCHPHFSTPTLLPCPFFPGQLKSCPCGSTPISLLLPTPRTSCTSRVPTCGAPCRKPLKECDHLCSVPCHLGDCSPCTEELVRVCRCGSQKKVVRCGEVNKEEEEEILTCDKPCRAMRSCGRHECMRKCCPLSYQEALKNRSKKRKKRFNAFEDEMGMEDPEGWHECDIVCGRKLSCGVHFCERKDHKGVCGNCLNASFEELICHCGSTILLPPVPCNTPIDCRHPCIRPPPCSLHPQLPHACHEDPEGCPPCPFLTQKKCACGKKIVGNVRCGGAEGSVRCGLVCGKLLKCAYHRCRKPCHPSGQCEHCDQTCLKPRKPCLHPCPSPCHFPSSCPTDTPCPKVIEITCSCGTLTQKVKCGSCDAKVEGNKDKVLKCDDRCEVEKRNKRVAEALGVEVKEKKIREVEYDQLLLGFYANNVAWAAGVETALTEFVTWDKPSMHFPSMRHPQRQFVHELAEKFELRSESLDEEPHRSVVVQRQSNSSIPTPTLAEALAAQRKNLSSSNLSFASLKKALPERIPNNSLYLEGVLGFDETALKDILRPRMAGLVFNVAWLADEDVLITFWPAPSESRLSSLVASLTNLIEDTGFAVTVEPVTLDDNGRVARGSWTPVNATASGSSSRANGKSSGGVSTSNSFTALSSSGNAEASASWGGGLSATSAKFIPTFPTLPTLPTLPPISTIVPEPAPTKVRTEPVPDDWEAEEEEEESNK